MRADERELRYCSCTDQFQIKIRQGGRLKLEAEMKTEESVKYLRNFDLFSRNLLTKDSEGPNHNFINNRKWKEREGNHSYSSKSTRYREFNAGGIQTG